MDENELDALLKDLCEKNKKVRLYSTSCLRDYIETHIFANAGVGLHQHNFLRRTQESMLTSVKIQSPALCVPCIQMCDYSST